MEKNDLLKSEMKHLIVKLLAFICYWTGLVSLFYALNKKAKRIVTFHNVIPQNLLPNGKKIGLIDTEESFSMKIREIQKHFSITSDLDDSSTLTITFDDGYCNEYEIVRNVVGDDVMGIIFISGQLINNSTPENALTVDLLLHWIELVPDGSYLVDYPTVAHKELICTQFNRMSLWQNIIWPSFVADSQTKGKGLLNALDRVYPLNKVLAQCTQDYLRLRLTGLSSAQIESIVASGWLVGWHTQEHFPLSSLTREQKVYEIDTCAPPEMKSITFSYPYGEMASVDAESQRIAEECGFPCAVSNLMDSSIDNKYFLPRFTLSDNKYLLHFELSGIKYFIMHGKHLPLY